MTETQYTGMTLLDAREHPWKIAEPMEVRIGHPRARQFQLTAEVRNGVVRVALDNGRGGSPESISNLQTKQMLPSKAFHGWQVEMLDALATSIYDVVEVR